MRGSAAFRAAVAPGGVLAGPWVKNELWRRARAVPTLDLRFAENKSLTDSVTGASLVTFTRASSGTYVGSDGLIKTATTDEPRFDHNPTTGESLGLLVEESRTNLLLRSEEFDSASWSKVTQGTGVTPVVTENYAVAPNGTFTANRLQANRGAGNSAGDQSSTNQNVSGLTDPHTITISIWAKSNTGSNQSVYFRNATGDGGSVITVTNEWQRFFISATRSGATSNNLQIGSRGANNTTNSVDILIWGAQLEAGAFPTSYISTTTAAVTRAADVASIGSSNATSWLTSFGENTFYTEYAKPPNVTGTLIEGFDGNTAITGITLNTTNNNRPRVTVRHGPSRLDSSTTNLPEYLSGNNKLVGATSASGSASAGNGTLYIGGSPAQSDWTITSTIGIGHRGFFGPRSFLNGTIRRICYWPARLPDSTLQQITL